MAVYKDSLFYSGAHSISIYNRNTWSSWHLIPTSRPVVNPPEVKTKYVDIPGANGSLDYTEALDGVKYGNRTGSWEFMVANGYAEWSVLYQEIMNYIHGKYLKVVLMDDPNYYYVGRLSINQWKSDQRYSTITIDYNFSPYKTPLRDTGGDVMPTPVPGQEDQSEIWTPVTPDTDPDTGTNPSGEPGSGTVTPGGGDSGTEGIIDDGTPVTPTEPISYADWLWNDVFGVDTNIYYGSFNVTTSKYRNVYNPNKTSTEATIITSGNTENFVGTVTYKNNSYAPVDGRIILAIDPGDNELYFEGNGNVTIKYRISGEV